MLGITEEDIGNKTDGVILLLYKATDFLNSAYYSGHVTQSCNLTRKEPTAQQSKLYNQCRKASLVVWLNLLHKNIFLSSTFFLCLPLRYAYPSKALLHDVNDSIPDFFLQKWCGESLQEVTSFFGKVCEVCSFLLWLVSSWGYLNEKLVPFLGLHNSQCSWGLFILQGVPAACQTFLLSSTHRTEAQILGLETLN